MSRGLTTNEFIEKAILTHGDKYDYSKVEYFHSRVAVIIGCRKHGWFKQKPETHIYGSRPSGCPICAYGGTPEERFWRFVKKSNGCWIWTGHIDYKGYGTFRGYNGKMTKAHAFSYRLHHGKIPRDNSHFGRLFILHHCDNPPCVNPDHLFLGTNADNRADVVAKGRKVGNSKLTWDEVREVRRLWQTTEWTQVNLGRVFNVSQATIGHIVRGNTWKE